jgi:predicted Zn-dependent protease
MKLSSNLAGNSRLAGALRNSGEAIAKAGEEFTPEQEYYIGRAVGATILTKYKLYKNKQQTDYLNKICAAITANSDRPDIFNGYHVAILDSAEINAFATSGGHILITRGLLENAKSEDMLAAVIAHEVAHIQLRHSLDAIEKSRYTQAITVTAVSAAGVASEGKDIGKLVDMLGGTVTDIVSVLVDSGYSKSQEFDADAKALSLLADAGYDPSSLVSMLNLLKQNQSKRPGGFNKTHPSPQDRIDEAQAALKGYARARIPAERTARYSAIMK